MLFDIIKQFLILTMWQAGCRSRKTAAELSMMVRNWDGISKGMLEYVKPLGQYLKILAQWICILVVVEIEAALEPHVDTCVVGNQCLV